MFFDMNEYQDELPMAMARQPKVTRPSLTDALQRLANRVKRPLLNILAVISILPILMTSWFSYKLAAYLLFFAVQRLVIYKVNEIADRVRELTAEVGLDNSAARLQSIVARLVSREFWRGLLHLGRDAARRTLHALADLLPFAVAGMTFGSFAALCMPLM